MHKAASTTRKFINFQLTEDLASNHCRALPEIPQIKLQISDRLKLTQLSKNILLRKMLLLELLFKTSAEWKSPSPCGKVWLETLCLKGKQIFAIMVLHAQIKVLISSISHYFPSNWQCMAFLRENKKNETRPFLIQAINCISIEWILHKGEEHKK